MEPIFCFVLGFALGAIGGGLAYASAERDTRDVRIDRILKREAEEAAKTVKDVEEGKDS